MPKHLCSSKFFSFNTQIIYCSGLKDFFWVIRVIYFSLELVKIIFLSLFSFIDVSVIDDLCHQIWKIYVTIK